MSKRNSLKFIVCSFKGQIFTQDKEINVCVCTLNVSANLWLCTAVHLNVLISICTHKSANCKCRLALYVYHWPDPNPLKLLRFATDLSISGSDTVGCFNKLLKMELAERTARKFGELPMSEVLYISLLIETYKTPIGENFILLISLTISEYPIRCYAAVKLWFAIPITLISIISV